MAKLKAYTWSGLKRLHKNACVKRVQEKVKQTRRKQIYRSDNLGDENGDDIMAELSHKVKVSIIVPVYNVEKYLDRCMRSLLTQTLQDIEIILIDDGSPDGSGKKCDEYSRQDNRIKVIHKKNEGLGYARNSGMEIATGEYVAFVDSDDFVAHEMYEIMYAKACEKDMDALFAGYYIYSRSGKVTRMQEVSQEIIYDDKKNRDNYLLQMIGSKPAYPKDSHFTMSVWRGIYKLDIIKKNKCRFPSERKVISEDIVFHIHFLHYATTIGMIPNCFYYYCENELSLTHLYREDRFEKVLKLLLTISDLFEKYRICDENYEYRDRLLLARARGAIRNVCNHADELGHCKTNKEIKKILDNSVLKECIQRYDYKKLPALQKMFYYAMRSNSLIAVKVLIKLNDWRKKG